MGFWDRFKGQEGFDREMETKRASKLQRDEMDVYEREKARLSKYEPDMSKLEVVDSVSKEDAGKYASSFSPRDVPIRLTNESAKRIEDVDAGRFESDARVREAERKKDYDVTKDIEKQRRIDREKAAIRREDAAFKIALERERKYGLGTFEIGGKKIPVLGQVSQYRNWQQEQDIKRLKQEREIQFQRNQLQQVRQQGGVSPPTMGGFGMPLSMGGGLGMGMGMSMGPSQSDMMQQPQAQRDPMSLSLPVIGGLGGGFGLQREEPQQEQQPQFVPQPRVSSRVEYPQYAARPANALESVPRYNPGARQVAYVSSKNPNVVQYGTEEQPGSIYIKTMQSYGPSYKKISPEEVVPEEKLYKRVRTPYGHKHILIR